MKIVCDEPLADFAASNFNLRYYNEDPNAYRRLASGATLHTGLPRVVGNFLAVVAFPFAHTASEEMARVEEAARSHG